MQGTAADGHDAGAERRRRPSGVHHEHRPRRHFRSCAPLLYALQGQRPGGVRISKLSEPHGRQRPPGWRRSHSTHSQDWRLRDRRAAAAAARRQWRAPGRRAQVRPL